MRRNSPGRLAIRHVRRLMVEPLEPRQLLSNFPVTTALDSSDAGDGLTSLREAVAQANEHAGYDTITFRSSLANGAVVLTGGQITISDPLSIRGSGAAQTKISGQNASRLFDITSTAGAVTFNGLTLTGGRTTGGSQDGGAIRSSSTGRLTILNSTISGNGTSGNFSDGGGIYAQGGVTVTNSTISGNFTSGYGSRGGGLRSDGSATITNSTISRNTTSGNTSLGGGVYAAASLKVTNSTITGNSVADDAKGGGAYSQQGPLTIRNSIVARNLDTQDGLNPDLFQAINGSPTVRFSLIGDNNGTGLSPAPIGSPDMHGNLIGTPAARINPKLGPLQNNGGQTKTHALLAGSPAINAGRNALATAPWSGEPDSEGFVSIFDGQSLSGWDGNPDFWSVEDGAITGRTTAENPTPKNTFLIWRNGEVGNFELKFEYKIVGGNSGLQYRSFEVPGEPWAVGGYQADFEAGDTYSGINYGERFRGILANRGQKTQITRNANGDVVVTELERFGDSAELQNSIRKENWNTYHVIARGFEFTHIINGKTMSICIDSDTQARRASGILALQLHAGSPMMVQFNDIRIKRLETAISAAEVPLTTDQRGAGFPRINFGRVDMGAVEYSAPPLIASFGGAATYTENATPTRVAPTATVTDSDSPNFYNGRLTAQLTANAQASDRLKILAFGNVSTSDDQVRFAGIQIGTYSGGVGATPLTIVFNADTNANRLTAVLRSIAFQNTSNNPSTSPRTLAVSLSDGDGGQSATVTKTMNVVAVNDGMVLNGDATTIDMASVGSRFTSSNAMCEFDEVSREELAVPIAKVIGLPGSRSRQHEEVKSLLHQPHGKRQANAQQLLRKERGLLDEPQFMERVAPPNRSFNDSAR